MAQRAHVGIAKFQKDLERRAFPRFLLNLPVEYHPVESPSASQGHTVNASQAGLMICLRELLEKGQNINLKIYFPGDTGLFQIETRAEVMWASPDRGKDGSYSYGVQFADIAPEYLDNLKSFLNRLSPDLIT